MAMIKDETPLPDDPEILKEMLRTAQGQIFHKDTKIKVLEEQIRLYLAGKYGRSSEQSQYHQLDLFENGDLPNPEDDTDDDEEALTDDDFILVKRKKKNGGRKPLPEHLTRIEVIHDLSPEDRICSTDGHPLHEIGRVVSEQLEIIPAVVQVKRHIRIKYGCKQCEQMIKLAALPPQPIPKSMASASLLAHIAICKFVDALPLYRQSNILKRSGIYISRATMATWMVVLGKNLQPLINLLRDQMLAGSVIHCDETTLQVLKETDRDPASTSYMWVQTTGPIKQPIILFDYDPSRSSQIPLRLLEGFKGYLHVDGYAGYAALGRQEDVILVGCWNHARRKFMDVIKAMKKSKNKKTRSGRATKGLNFIKRLYGIEREIKDKPAEEKYALRQARAKPILDDIRKWVNESKPRVAPKTLIGKAVNYLDNQWEKLIRYIDDGRLNIDNNHAENAIRPYVVGRKNWLFFDSTKGAHAGASIYSIVETAKANGLNPFSYLHHVIEKLPGAETLEDIERLLPWNVDLG